MVLNLKSTASTIDLEGKVSGPVSMTSYINDGTQMVVVGHVYNFMETIFHDMESFVTSVLSVVTDADTTKVSIKTTLSTVVQEKHLCFQVTQDNDNGSEHSEAILGFNMFWASMSIEDANKLAVLISLLNEVSGK